MGFICTYQIFRCFLQNVYDPALSGSSVPQHFELDDACTLKIIGGIAIPVTATYIIKVMLFTDCTCRTTLMKKLLQAEQPSYN